MGWLIVEVWKKSSSGQMWPWEYCEVTGEVSGVFRGMTESVRTDDRGIARINWSGNNDLECLFIRGRRINGPFESGRTYPPIVVDW